MANKSALFNSMIDSVQSPVVEMAEYGLDEIVEQIIVCSPAVKSIPVIGLAISAVQVASLLKEAFFIKKYAAFIGPLYDYKISNSKENEKVESVLKNEKTLNEIAGKTLVAIDAYKNEQMTKLLGRLWVKTVKEKIFSLDEYNTLMYSLEMIHPSLGLKLLQQFYDIYKKQKTNLDKTEKEQLEIEQCNLDYS